MAMIKCPECGQDISDKAKKCIHCGKVFVNEEVVQQEIKCVECGMTLSEQDELCPNCGCPVEKEVTREEVKLQQVELSGIKVKKKTRRVIAGVISLIFICILGGIVYKIFSKKNYQETYNAYIDNLKKAQEVMLSGGSKSETLCNLTLKVWNNSIHKKSDSETDKYTKTSRFFVSDFNVALNNLFADEKTTSTVSEIKDNQSAVKEIMKKLQDVPEGLDKCYDTVLDLNTAYSVLTDLAISPSGNYNSYSNNKSEAVSDFMSSYKKLDTQIPDKK